MTERLIGIDFGTSTTVVHVKNYTDGKPSGGDGTSIQYVEFDGQGMVPTLIQKAEDTYYFGYDAKQPKKDERLYRNFKMKLESSDEKERKEAEELTLLFFRFLHEAYEEQKVHFGTAQSERTLISYPAKWTERTRLFMISCAERAGFPNVRGMDEPTAAMYSVCVQERERMEGLGVLKKGKSSYVLMIDMGAGTTDLALCRYQAGAQAEILLTWPSTEAPLFFGGHEMDRILMDVLKNYLLENGFSEDGVARFMSQYEETCRVWKENTVSGALAENKQVDFCFFISSVFQIMGITPGKFPVISRDSLEHTAGGYLKIYAMLVNGILEEAKKKIQGFSGSEQIDLVILTGGHSQWYFAESVLTGEVDTGIPVSIAKIKERPERVIRLSRPQETVARGMVYSGQEIMVVSKEEETAGDNGQTAETGTSAGTKKDRKTTETAKDAGLGKTSDSGKAAGNTEKSMDGGKTAGTAGKKKVNAPAQEAREADADGSEAGFREMMDKQETERRFKKITYFYDNKIGEKMLRDSGWQYHKAMEAYIGDVYLDKKYLDHRKPSQSTVELFMNVLGRPVTEGNEKILYAFFEGSGIIDTRSYCWLVTTEKALLLSKNEKEVTEFTFSDIRYFTSVNSFINNQWDKRFCGEDYERGQILMRLYARWRAAKGLDPYRLDVVDYYESVKHTELGKDGSFLNRMGLEYMHISSEKAFRLFTDAERAGNKYALLNLAYCYYFGHGTGKGKDYRRAADCIEQFIGQMTGEEKMSECCWWGDDSVKCCIFGVMGVMYEKGGYGLNPDIEKAIFYYNMGKNYDADCTRALRRVKGKKIFDYFKKK